MVLRKETHARGASAAEGRDKERDRIRFFAMGTQCEVIFSNADEKAGKAFTREATNWVHEFEAKYSRYKSDSLISRINGAAGRDWVALDPDAERMFALADQVYVLTRGLVDPTALPLMRIWNYQAAKPTVPSKEAIQVALSRVGWTRVRRNEGRIYLPETGMGLDLGGFGKEYAVDCVAELARKYEISDVLVDFGHDVRVSGRAPDGANWTIGIEDPQRPGTVRSRLVVEKGGVATSGDYLRYFESDGLRYGHIIDPRTGYPVSNDCLSVTVVANSCLEAGLLATTAFVLGGEEGLHLIEEYFGAEGCVSCTDREYQTRGFYKYVV